MTAIHVKFQPHPQVPSTPSSTSHTVKFHPHHQLPQDHIHETKVFGIALKLRATALARVKHLAILIFFTNMCSVTLYKHT